MHKLSWTDKYSIGHALIDLQHRRLFDLYNSLIAFDCEKSQKSDIEHILDELAKYAEEHFATEENAMTTEDYADIHEHKSEHVVFFIQVYKIRIEINRDLKKGVNQLRAFLYDWLKSHIPSHDMKFGKFLTELKAKSIPDFN